MGSIGVHFTYFTGIKTKAFHNARLSGSWDLHGHYSNSWTTIPMTEAIGDDGCQCFRATIQLDDSQVGWTFRWGVMLDAPSRPNTWGICAEVNDSSSRERHCAFVLNQANQEEQYFLTHCRRLGANKLFTNNTAGQPPAIRFAVWAPNAQKVELVIGDLNNGYIANNGHGITRTFPMFKRAGAIWETDVAASLDLADFSAFDHAPYMFKITKDNGAVAYRTDLYSRCQAGKGTFNPNGNPYTGHRVDLDGSVSCSVVKDPEKVAAQFSENVWPETHWVSDDDFWADEFDLLRPLPTRPEDLVIYELHVGGLGFGEVDAQGDPVPGKLKHAMALLDHLEKLGVNAIELLPLAEFDGWASWGYGTSHFSAIEFSSGGRDQFKHFIRACHQRGIAVILDVVYNHYHHEAERAEWAYDSDAPEKNIYYWYEGRAADYPHPDGGYIDNESTGYAPRYCEDMVRKMFISSAVSLMIEFHLDGFRVDQTTSIHSYAKLHANGHPADQARIYGIKFLREWVRTLRLLKPTVFLFAEDHSGWDEMTKPLSTGGVGFDANWYADFYHHLSGDTDKGSDYAKLIRQAGLSDFQPLAMSYFSGALYHSRHRTVVYHESHDEAGNSRYKENGLEKRSGRTISVAVNGAALVGDTRRYAEARSRFAAGMALLSPGTPMFFMGEEIGFQKEYRYNDFVHHKEDFIDNRNNGGARLFNFYQDLITLRHRRAELRSHNIDILVVDDNARVLIFRRWQGDDAQLLVLASLNNSPFSSGYDFNSRVPEGQWCEVFNSDAAVYGGNNHGNLGGTKSSSGGNFSAVIPANGFVVFRRI
jgi:1,4-alpha-glucan branching enzyme